MEYEALQKLDELMNKIPIPQTTWTQSTTTQNVTFDSTTKPAAEMPPTPRVRIETPTPRTQEILPPPRVQGMPTPRTQAIIPLPRVQESTPTLRVQPTSQTITAATVDKPLRRMARNTAKRNPTPTQTKIRNKISDARNLRSRLSTRTHMQLRPYGQPQRYGERAQLVQDEATGEYLNYRQLMRHPTHHHTW